MTIRAIRHTRAFCVVLAFATYLVSLSAQAQFSYLGTEFQYSNQQLNGEGSANYIQSWTLRVSAMHRPWRNVGIGITYPFRISQRPAYTPFGLGGYGGWGDGFKPAFLYEISNNEELSAFVRVFASAEINAFLDLRVTSYFFESSLSLARGYRPAEYYDGELWYAEIPSRYASQSSGTRSLAPGFGIGIMPHFGKHGFFSFQFNFDLVQQKARDLNIRIESNSRFEQSWYDYKTIRTELDGRSMVLSVGMGAGVFF